MSRLGLDIPIEVMPWVQSYGLIQKEAGVALYSIARTPERDRLFAWVGPITSYENWLYAKKGSGIRVSSLEEAREVKVIAAVKDEAAQQRLAKHGFGNFRYASSSVEGLKILMAGHADLWLGTKEDIALVAQKAGINPNELESVVFVHKLDLYVAFNKNTSPSIIRDWQNAFESIKKQGVIR